MTADLLPIAHASGRAVGTKGAPTDAVVAAEIALLASKGALVITLTECARRAVLGMAPGGWTVVHHPGPGTGETAVLLAPTVNLKKAELVALTPGDKNASARFGMYRHDQYAVKATCEWRGQWFAVMVAHTPSHLTTPYALRLWRNTVSVLAARAGDRTIVAADWNLNLLQPLQQRALRRYFPRHTLAAPTVPTNGRRAIDGFMVPAAWGRGKVRTVDYTHDATGKPTGLDHLAVALGIQFPAKETPVPTPPAAPQPKPYDLTTYDGKKVDWLTRTALEEAAKRLGYDLTLMQGSYNAGGVSASAGTHDGGGVIDLAPWDYARKVKVLRDLGFAAWHRTPIPGVWGEHIHAVLIGNKKLAPAAVNQVSYYRAGLDGLADHAKDPDPYRPNPIPVWHMPKAAS